VLAGVALAVGAAVALQRGGSDAPDVVGEPGIAMQPTVRGRCFRPDII
jgi:hypothetical protein